MIEYTLHPPTISGQRALFGWTTEPATPLYRQTRFFLEFPAGIDLARVPARLWWDLLLICLHPHWMVQRPCRVRLPVRLGPGERAFWSALVQNGIDTLDAYRKTPAEAGVFEIGDGTHDLPRTAISGHGFGTSFSGGKDSLLQAGLLAELTEQPLLVATTSPMAPHADHETERRRHVLSEIQRRRAVRFVEVRSDYRSIWDNSFALDRGYSVAINEISDTHLYSAALMAAAAALGVTHLFLASEAEVQENDVIGGKVVQHPHFMYAAATQRAIARLVAAYGLTYGSLTWPLYSALVQTLLWQRYPDLSDLQYSCWKVGRGEAACSQCEQCMRIALTALAAGHDPQRMGIDLAKVMRFARRWAPLREGIPAGRSPKLAVGRRFTLLTADALRRSSARHLWRLVARGRAGGLLAPAAVAAVADFRRAQRAARRLERPPPIGAREGFCDWLDPALKPQLIGIFKDNLPWEPRDQHRGLVERSALLAGRATEALN